MQQTIIPTITHELGRYWKQPQLREILVDDKHAVMSESTLKKLANYSDSAPTGAYAGKMWRSQELTLNKSKSETMGTTHYLHWYVDFDDTHVCTETREIILL